MANPSKAKGDKAELEAARQLAELTGWPVRRRLGAGRLDDTGDLDGIPDTTVGVKNYRDQTRAIREALAELPQQQANAGTTFGCSLIRRPGGHYFAVLTLQQLAALLREATTPAAGHEMRQLWEADDRWHVLCECGHILAEQRQHTAVDAWHAHRDEHESPRR